MNKLSADTRINLLFDEGSVSYVSRQNNGIITGFAGISGHKVAFFVQDFSVKGGSITKEIGRIARDIMNAALEMKIPLISVYDSGGARLQDGVHALYGVADILNGHRELKGKVPQIALVLGPCAGGSAYGPTICDFIFMVKDISEMFVTGPGVVKRLTGENISIEELGGADIHNSTTGICHFLADTEPECFQMVRQLFGYISETKTSSVMKKTDDLSDDIVPFDNKLPYDVHAVIDYISDKDSFFEIQKDYAKSIVCGFARFEGRTCGIIADQPNHLAGAIDTEAAEKAERFIATLNSFNIPFISIVDTPGFLPGKEQEHGKLLLRGARLFSALSGASVPIITLILRKAYGGAYIVMGAKTVGQRYCFAWDEAQIGVMLNDAAVDIIYKNDISDSKDMLLNRYEDTLPTLPDLLEAGYVDRIIKRNESRKVILETLDLIQRNA
jgi:acetyl-CoA/propionyl-CoA carboxylase carboxyl transferase subunit